MSHLIIDKLVDIYSGEDVMLHRVVPLSLHDLHTGVRLHLLCYGRAINVVANGSCYNSQFDSSSKCFSLTC